MTRTGYLYNKLKAAKLYLLLWGFTIAIAATMLLLEKKGDQKDALHIMKPGFNSASVTNQTINELLLTAKDLNLDEKKSFINLYLKSGDDIEAANNQAQPISVYNKIFEKKVDIIKTKKKQKDFSIQPIPK